jgi:hypothetical protein
MANLLFSINVQEFCTFLYGVIQAFHAAKAFGIKTQGMTRGGK